MVQPSALSWRAGNWRWSRQVSTASCPTPKGGTGDPQGSPILSLFSGLGPGLQTEPQAGTLTPCVLCTLCDCRRCSVFAGFSGSGSLVREVRVRDMNELMR